MGFGFLAPMFLAGLAALAIPVLVHLVHKQDAAVKAFPSLMFLQRAPSPLQRRREIKHWLLLALRCLGLALMVLAFAQPFIERGPTTVAMESDRHDMVLLMDRSYSMDYGDHWSRAQEAGRAAIGELAGADRVALVYFDSAARISKDFTVDHESVVSAIENTLPGPRPTDFTVGLRRAARLLENSDADLREIRLISDFQSSGWNHHVGFELSEDIRLETVEINSPDAWNSAVWLPRRRLHRGDDSVAIEASVRDGRQEAVVVDPLQVTLSLEGKNIESVRLEGGAHGERNARFVLPTPNQGTAKGELGIADDGLPADDSFRFALRDERPVPVLVVEGVRSRNHQSAFLVEALRLSEDPRFVVETKRQDQLEVADLSDASIVVFNETSTPGRDIDDALLDFVGSGGGLLAVAGAGTSSAEALGPRQLAPTLSGDDRQGATKGSHRITWIEVSHPALALFASPNEIDLSAPQFSRYQALELKPEDTVIARFDDGGAALVERIYEKGRVLTWSTTLDTHWSDFPLQPLYLPFLHELMKYLAGYSPLASWQYVGDAVDLLAHFRAHSDVDAARVRSIDSVVVESPSGGQTRVPAATPLLIVDEPGWYELHVPGEDKLRDFVAVNVDPVEADLRPLSTTEFLASIDRAAVEQPSARPQPRTTPGPGTETPRIWWYVLLLALIILATETLVSNRLSSKA